MFLVLFENLGIVIAPNLYNLGDFDNPMKVMDFTDKLVSFFQRVIEYRKKNGAFDKEDNS